ncbi:MAG: hypothetical protein OEY93_10115 [Anaerolineae bacterium]|nr:hypothetical protein [Anaerolineae bacterium]
MSKDQTKALWQTWAKKLIDWNIGDISADILEASGPLTLVTAQLVYFTQPVLSGLWPRDDLTALANMLEEPEQKDAFISLLREESV